MEIKYRYRKHIGGEILENTVGAEFYVREGTIEGALPITAVSIGINNVNSFHLALRTFLDKGESSRTQKLVLIDNGSKRSHTWDLIRRIIDERGEGIGLRLADNIGHGGATDIVGQSESLVTTEFLLLFDYDTEVLTPGGIDKLMSFMAPDVFAVGRYINLGAIKIGHIQGALGHDRWQYVPNFSTDYCLWRAERFKTECLAECATGYWDDKEQHFYDLESRITMVNLQKGFRFVNFDPKGYIYHEGGMTTFRFHGSSNEVYCESFYQKITDKLRQMGVPEGLLFHDKVNEDDQGNPLPEGGVKDHVG